MKQPLFRAWDTENLQMVRAIDISHFRFHEDGRWSYYRGDTEVIDANSGMLMQSTGLKDRNGKDIYSEDIVKDDSFRSYVVDWYDNGWALREVNGGYYSGHRHFKDVTYMEVIGNVYETPERLKS